MSDQSIAQINLINNSALQTTRSVNQLATSLSRLNQVRNIGLERTIFSMRAISNMEFSNLKTAKELLKDINETFKAASETKQLGLQKSMEGMEKLIYKAKETVCAIKGIQLESSNMGKETTSSAKKVKNSFDMMSSSIKLVGTTIDLMVSIAKARLAAKKIVQSKANAKMFVGAKAAMAKKSALTLGAAVPAILAATAIGTAAISRLAQTTGTRVSNANIAGTIGSSIASRSVAMSQGGNIEQATYAGMVRALEVYGIRDKQTTVELNIDSQEFARATAQSLMEEYKRQGVW